MLKIVVRYIATSTGPVPSVMRFGNETLGEMIKS